MKLKRNRLRPGVCYCSVSHPLAEVIGLGADTRSNQVADGRTESSTFTTAQRKRRVNQKIKKIKTKTVKAILEADQNT